MRKLLSFIVMLVMSVTMLMAQNRTVTGTVTSAEDGEPIIGASVVVVGTNLGTVTDIDGKFSLSVPQSAKTLRFSYVGMEPKEAPVKDKMNIQLGSDEQILEDVVVTAMGIKRDRKALGYAAQDLKSEQLSKAGTNSLANAIQGKLTGVDVRSSSGAPGASAQIVIRGARSFSGNNQPLYVVDGMPINTTADFGTGNSVTGANKADRSIDINPEDIETINVLKGQAASALYGIRASNGVIVITTKRGSKNVSKPQVTISTDLSAQTMARKFERQTTYAQGNGVSAYSPSSSMSWGPKIVDLPNDKTYGGNVDNKYTQADGLHQGMYYNTKRAQAGLSGWTTPEIYDNVGDFFGTGFTENTNVSLSQNINGLTYSFSVSNSHQTGIIPSTGMDRWGARGVVDWKINKQWNTGFSANYTTNEITSAPGANSGIANVVFSAPAEYDLKGIPCHVPGDPTTQISFRSTSFNNPYWWKDNDEFLQHTNRMFGNMYLEYTPDLGWDGFTLKFREQAGIDMWTSNYADKAEVGSAINKNGEIENYGVQENVFNNLFTINLDGKFGADKQFGLNVILGNEINEDNARSWDYYGSNFNFYGFPTMANATNFSSSESTSEERTVGFFGSASLDWASQLYLTLTARTDYVSTMPRGSRNFFYPSVSLGWEFTKLPFLQDQKVLTYGKLRASFAQVGQAGHYYKTYYTTPGYGGGFYSYTPVTFPLPSGVSAYVPSSTLYDPNLKPQNTTNWELGADLALLNGRFRLEYTYSRQDVKDQIFSVPTDRTTGYSSMMTNAGKMETDAHELGINAAIVQTRDWDVNLGANFTKMTNKVVELAEGVESIMLGGFVEPQVRAQAGCTYPNIYGYGFARSEDGQLLLLEGLPYGTSEMQDLGGGQPDWTLGWTFNVRWKKLSLNTTWSYQTGGHMYHGTNMVMNYFGVTKESLPYHEGTMIAEGIDVATGQKNTVEVSKQDYYMSYYDVTESGIYDTDYVKLRDVTLNYDLPKIGGVNVSVYAFARNILLWSKLPNFDPEASQGNGNMSGYFERFSIPSTSSFGGGLKVSF